MKKFDIYLADFNPRKGHAQSGIRPCIIIQSNIFNPYSTTVIVVPLTSVTKKIFPSELYIIPSDVNGLSSKSRFLGSQIITLDKKFLTKKLGILEKNYYEEIHQALSIVLDMEDEY